MLLLLPSQKDFSKPGMPLREAPIKGMRRHGLEALPPLLRESLSKGKRRPQWVPQDTPRAGTLALQESKSAVLMGTTSRFPEKDPPGEIEGEPGGLKNFDLKRPFEAKESNDVGHTGHHKKTKLVTSKVHQ